MSKEAVTDYPVHELIARRWSPYGFSDRVVSADDLCHLFEAARWAASSYNEQPWSYIVATKEDRDQFNLVLNCLVEGNQQWAQAAPVLALAVASLRFQRNDKPNQAAIHDLGLAAGNLCLEATSRGLSVHQMIGILPDKARETFDIPDGYNAVTGLAVGYVAQGDELDEKLRQRDGAIRTRKPLSDFVYSGRWGQTAVWLVK